MMQGNIISDISLHIKDCVKVIILADSIDRSILKTPIWHFWTLFLLFWR